MASGKKQVKLYKIRMEEKNKGGRPSIFTKELGDTICLRIGEGESLRHICEEEGMPSARVVHLWLLEEGKTEFFQQYLRARNIQAETMFEEILDIADDGTNDYMTITRGDNDYNVEDREVTNRSKLRVEARKWYLSKVLPKKFGDKLDVTSDGKPIPLISNVFRDNSTKQNNSPQEEN